LLHTAFLLLWRKAIGKKMKKNFEIMTFVVFLYDKCQVMKKKTTSKKTVAYTPNDFVSKAEDPEAFFSKSIKAIPQLKNFTYSEFKKISDKTPFTQAEWAVMLHVSERTLQRYAKSNGSFAPINAERAMQLSNVIKRGKEVFGSVDKFYNWIKRNPYMMEGNLSLAALTTSEGINLVLTQLGRIEHGLFA
jgi:putative toxin-antitoxin system antitoxin component (TIGR02293 family)